MSTVHARPAPGQRFLLREVDWETYSRLLRVFTNRPSIRLTYDRSRPHSLSNWPGNPWLRLKKVAMAARLALEWGAG